MKTHKTILQVDAVIQLALIFFLAMSGLATIGSKGDAAIFFGITLFATGAWQMLSGIVLGIIRNDEVRGKYVFGSIFYIGILFWGASSGNFSERIGMLLALIFIALIPCCIAIWYFRYTFRDLRKINSEFKGLTKVDSSMNDILDSEEIFKPKL